MSLLLRSLLFIFAAVVIATVAALIETRMGWQVRFGAGFLAGVFAVWLLPELYGLDRRK